MSAPRLLALILLLAPPAAAAPPPRLAVVVVVDQMRADFLVRFRPHFGPDGFRRLLEGGADYRDCHYQHAVTVTAPGHATILSGVNANVHGIIANEWLDRTTLIQGNAVEDPAAPLVGLPPRAGRHPNATFAAKAGRSPRNFLGTTVGDRLKAHYGAAAKVVGIADKDRSAILPAGAKADGAYWTEEGVFVTSTYYRTELPAWVQAFNARRNAAHYFGQTWDRLLAPAIYEAVQGPDDQPGEQAEDGLAITFPKRVDGGKPQLSPDYYSAFDHTPWNNELVEEMAEAAIAAEQLGQDETPDLLTIGFSQPDKSGHAYGPDSHEIMDSYVRLDRTLARLLAFLDAKVGAGRWVLVLTADHGVMPLPERAAALGGTRDEQYGIAASLRLSLEQILGPLPAGLEWAVRDGRGFRLLPAALRATGLEPARVGAALKSVLQQHPRIAAAYTREELTAPAPLDALGEMVRRSYHAERSPEVLFLTKPYFTSRRFGVDHGTPYDYDTHVPQLWYGNGVAPGIHPERVGVEDLAPTLAGLLGVDLPPEARGKRLF
jgi:arylsulfatase A-like enzyme